MLTHWITAVPQDQQEKFRQSGPSSLAHQVSFDQNNLNRGSVLAIIGWDPVAALHIRNNLYALRDFTQYINIIDLGDFKKTNYDFVISALHELVDAKIHWILLGGTASLADLQLKLFETRGKSFQAASLHECHPFGKVLSEFPEQRLTNLFCIGHQSHLPSDITENQLLQENIEFFRLGQVKANVQDVEPSIRTADFIDLHLSCLRKSDLPAQTGLSTSGLTLDETCQLMRYGGFSDKTRSLTISGWDPAAESAEDSANAIAQLIWYYGESLDRSFPSVDRKEDHLTEFMVHLETSDTHLSFYKDERFGTWWVRLHTFQHEHSGPLLPCSYDDYHAACKNMLSDRIFRLVRRA